MIYFRIFPQQCGLVVPLPMVIVGRGEEGLQRRQRTSLDRQNSPNSPECAAAADGSTTDANSNATAATAEAEAQSTAHSGSKLPKIRQKFHYLGNWLIALKSIHWVNSSARSSFFEKGIILTKPFQHSQSWQQLPFFEKGIIRSFTDPPSFDKIFGEEKFSLLPSKYKVAAENLHFHRHTNFLIKLQFLVLFISYFVFRRQPADFFLFQK